MRIWVTADTHFNHNNIIKYCNRPFSSVEDMDNSLIANWNACVGKHDMVYILGDFSLSKSQYNHELCRKLNGRKILIKGNHDGQDSAYTGMERVIRESIIINRGEKMLILSHVPIPVEGTQFYNLHGHIHSNSVTANSIDVGVDGNDYKPILLDDAIRKMEEMNGKGN